MSSTPTATLEQDLPPVGSQVTTTKGLGRVVAQEILAQKLVIEFDDRRRIIVAREELREVQPPRRRAPTLTEGVGRQLESESFEPPSRDSRAGRVTADDDDHHEDTLPRQPSPIDDQDDPSHPWKSKETR